MELTQLEQMIRWLDDERKRDKATIAMLQERLEQQLQVIESQAVEIERAHHDIAELRTDLRRTDDYPALVEMTAKNFDLVRTLVVRCQAAGILNPGEPDLVAVGVWGLVHGFVSLIQQGQVSRSVLDRYSVREMLIVTLNQISCVEIDTEKFVLNPPAAFPASGPP